MAITAVFNEVVEAADSLSVAEQEALIDILRHRLAETKRRELVAYVQEARAEYRSGQVQIAEISDIMDDILS